jgi:hypothetical protein
MTTATTSADKQALEKRQGTTRYTHRVAISNRRLVSAADDGVAFRWNDYRLDGPPPNVGDLSVVARCHSLFRAAGCRVSDDRR